MSIADDLEKLVQLRTKGTLTDEEFALAKTRLLSPAGAAALEQARSLLEEQFVEIQHQNQVAQFDREWDLEERRYQVRGSYGLRYCPTIGMGVVIMISGGLFGLLWVVTACYLPEIINTISPFAIRFSTVNNAIFTIGVLVIVASLIRGISLCAKAAAYNQAFNAYRRKRRQLVESPG